MPKRKSNPSASGGGAGSGVTRTRSPPISIPKHVPSTFHEPIDTVTRKRSVSPRVILPATVGGSGRRAGRTGGGGMNTPLQSNGKRGSNHNSKNKTRSTPYKGSRFEGPCRTYVSESSDEEDYVEFIYYWSNLTPKERLRLLSVDCTHLLNNLKEECNGICTCSVCGGQRNTINAEIERLFKLYCDEIVHSSRRPPCPTMTAASLRPDSTPEECASLFGAHGITLHGQRLCATEQWLEQHAVGVRAVQALDKIAHMSCRVRRVGANSGSQATSREGGSRGRSSSTGGGNGSSYGERTRAGSKDAYHSDLFEHSFHTDMRDSSPLDDEDDEDAVVSGFEDEDSVHPDDDLLSSGLNDDVEDVDVDDVYDDLLESSRGDELRHWDESKKLFLVHVAKLMTQNAWMAFKEKLALDMQRTLLESEDLERRHQEREKEKKLRQQQHAKESKRTRHKEKQQQQHGSPESKTSHTQKGEKNSSAGKVVVTVHEEVSKHDKSRPVAEEAANTLKKKKERTQRTSGCGENGSRDCNVRGSGASCTNETERKKSQPLTDGAVDRDSATKTTHTCETNSDPDTEPGEEHSAGETDVLHHPEKDEDEIQAERERARLKREEKVRRERERKKEIAKRRQEREKERKKIRAAESTKFVAATVSTSAHEPHSLDRANVVKSSPGATKSGSLSANSASISNAGSAPTSHQNQKSQNSILQGKASPVSYTGPTRTETNAASGTKEANYAGNKQNEKASISQSNRGGNPLNTLRSGGHTTKDSMANDSSASSNGQSNTRASNSHSTKELRVRGKDSSVLNDLEYSKVVQDKRNSRELSTKRAEELVSSNTRIITQHTGTHPTTQVSTLDDRSQHSGRSINFTGTALTSSSTSHSTKIPTVGSRTVVTPSSVKITSDPPIHPPSQQAVITTQSYASQLTPSPALSRIVHQNPLQTSSSSVSNVWNTTATRNKILAALEQPTMTAHDEVMPSTSAGRVPHQSNTRSRNKNRGNRNEMMMGRSFQGITNQSCLKGNESLSGSRNVGAGHGNSGLPLGFTDAQQQTVLSRFLNGTSNITTTLGNTNMDLMHNMENGTTSPYDDYILNYGAASSAFDVAGKTAAGISSHRNVTNATTISSLLNAPLNHTTHSAHTASNRSVAHPAATGPHPSQQQQQIRTFHMNPNAANFVPQMAYPLQPNQTSPSDVPLTSLLFQNGSSGPALSDQSVTGFSSSVQHGAFPIMQSNQLNTTNTLNTTTGVCFSGAAQPTKSQGNSAVSRGASLGITPQSPLNYNISTNNLSTSPASVPQPLNSSTNNSIVGTATGLHAVPGGSSVVLPSAMASVSRPTTQKPASNISLLNAKFSPSSEAAFTSASSELGTSSALGSVDPAGVWGSSSNSNWNSWGLSNNSDIENSNVDYTAIFMSGPSIDTSNESLWTASLSALNENTTMNPAPQLNNSSTLNQATLASNLQSDAATCSLTAPSASLIEALNAGVSLSVESTTESGKFAAFGGTLFGTLL